MAYGKLNDDQKIIISAIGLIDEYCQQKFHATSSINPKISPQTALASDANVAKLNKDLVKVSVYLAGNRQALAQVKRHLADYVRNPIASKRKNDIENFFVRTHHKLRQFDKPQEVAAAIERVHQFCKELEQQDDSSALIEHEKARLSDLALLSDLNDVYRELLEISLSKLKVIEGQNSLAQPSDLTEFLTHQDSVLEKIIEAANLHDRISNKLSNAQAECSVNHQEQTLKDRLRGHRLVYDDSGLFKRFKLQTLEFFSSIKAALNNGFKKPRPKKNS